MRTRAFVIMIAAVALQGFAVPGAAADATLLLEKIPPPADHGCDHQAHDALQPFETAYAAATQALQQRVRDHAAQSGGAHVDMNAMFAVNTWSTAPGSVDLHARADALFKPIDDHAQQQLEPYRKREKFCESDSDRVAGSGSGQCDIKAVFESARPVLTDWAKQNAAGWAKFLDAVHRQLKWLSRPPPAGVDPASHMMQGQLLENESEQLRALRFVADESLHLCVETQHVTSLAGETN